MESEMYPVNSSSQDVNCMNLALFFFRTFGALFDQTTTKINWTI